MGGQISVFWINLLLTLICKNFFRLCCDYVSKCLFNLTSQFNFTTHLKRKVYSGLMLRGSKTGWSMILQTWNIRDTLCRMWTCAPWYFYPSGFNIDRVVGRDIKSKWDHLCPMDTFSSLVCFSEDFLYFKYPLSNGTRHWFLEASLLSFCSKCLCMYICV